MGKSPRTKMLDDGRNHHRLMAQSFSAFDWLVGRQREQQHGRGTTIGGLEWGLASLTANAMRNRGIAKQ